MTAQNANDGEPERFEAAHLAMVAVGAAAPYVRASAELAAGRAIMLREERIKVLERIAGRAEREARAAAALIVTRSDRIAELEQITRDILHAYREVIGPDIPEDVAEEITGWEATLKGTP
ncbi:MAG TPA: hypothetical protein VK599_21735 [Streptosporangiaceae bacterium]|nr:hypothetical protein [Streptosporangiaceae bacterium]